ncbi:hypothetical protein KIMC2_16530 [Xylocopilactobacillus apis]|uniref:ABC-type glycine betaine transport system substrate-binding domain-containing protein n=1 Tax=Xylocopilactobacillus apis TaxID=2932183 RepID=A0AAU9DFQ9_9LACO|nr:hypothetical protein KIMC2_16530 [Xylocopilactobacillus apis]
MLGLEKKYGKFKFKSTAVYDNSLKYQILKSNKADATPAYTTEGQLANSKEYTVLKDDRNFWPSYNIVPVIRIKTLKLHPKVKGLLNKINKKLTTKTIIRLNADVDSHGKSYQKVAKNFYKSIK